MALDTREEELWSLFVLCSKNPHMPLWITENKQAGKQTKNEEYISFFLSAYLSSLLLLNISFPIFISYLVKTFSLATGD